MAIRCRCLGRWLHWRYALEPLRTDFVVLLGSWCLRLRYMSFECGFATTVDNTAR
jgi:hypothetical protein